MKAKIISLCTIAFIMAGTVVFIPINVNATMLNGGPTCDASLGGSCECAEGQNCVAGVFKCRCTTPIK